MTKTTIATNRKDFMAQLDATIHSTDVLSASVVHAVRNVIKECGNPASIGFILSGLEEKRYATRAPKLNKAVIGFINSFVGCVKEKDDDGVYRETEQGDYILKKSEKRLAKIFENHEIEGFEEGMSQKDLAPLMEKLDGKLTEWLGTRELSDENDDNEEPSIFAGEKDSRTDAQKEADKESKASAKKVNDKKKWDNGGKEKHVAKIKDMDESFLGCIELVLKAYGKSKEELIDEVGALLNN